MHSRRLFAESIVPPHVLLDLDYSTTKQGEGKKVNRTCFTLGLAVNLEYLELFLPRTPCHN